MSEPAFLELSLVFGGAALGFGGVVGVVLAGEHTSAEGGIDHQGEVEFADEVENFQFQDAVQEVVGALDGDEGFGVELLGDGVLVGHLPGVVVGAADVAGFSGFDEMVEGGDGFVDGGVGVGVVEEVEVDVVGLEAFEGAVDGVEDVDAGVSADAVVEGVFFVDLGAEEEGVAFVVGFEDLAEEGFGFAVGVGGVDEVDAVGEGIVGDALGGGEVGFGAEGHGAEGEAGDGEGGGAEAGVVHGVDCRREFVESSSREVVKSEERSRPPKVDRQSIHRVWRCNFFVVGGGLSGGGERGWWSLFWGNGRAEVAGGLLEDWRGTCGQRVVGQGVSMRLAFYCHFGGCGGSRGIAIPRLWGGVERVRGYDSAAVVDGLCCKRWRVLFA